MTAPCRIFFPGDKVRVTLDGWPVSAVIKDFAYDLSNVGPGDVANVVVILPGASPLQTGHVAPVSCTDLEGGWD